MVNPNLRGQESQFVQWRVATSQHSCSPVPPPHPTTLHGLQLSLSKQSQHGGGSPLLCFSQVYSHPGRLWTDSRPDLGTTFIPDWQRFHRYQKRPVLWLEMSILKLSLRPPAASTQLSHLASSLLMEIIFVSSEVLQTKIHLLTILSFVKWMIICCAKMSNWATWHPFCRCAVATAERV